MQGSWTPRDVAGCDTLVSPKKLAIGAPIAIARTAAIRSLLICIGEGPLARDLRDRTHIVAEGGDRIQDLLRADDGACVVRHVDVERGVHHLVRVVRRRILHDRDLVAEFGGEANRGLDTGVRDQANDDELMDTMLLELQVEICVGKAARAPMFAGDDLVSFGYELGAEFATPCAIFEGLVTPRRLLNRRDVLPGFVVARTVAVVHGVEYRKLRVTHGIQDA